MRNVVAIVILGWYALAALIVVTQVGKPREPLTGGVAAFTLLVSGLSAWGIAYLWQSA